MKPTWLLFSIPLILWQVSNLQLTEGLGIGLEIFYMQNKAKKIPWGNMVARPFQQPCLRGWIMNPSLAKNQKKLDFGIANETYLP